MKAKRLMPRPDAAITASYEKAKARWPKYLPRAPKPEQKEILLRVERPYPPLDGPVVYQAGDYFPVTAKVAVPEGWVKDAPPGIVADWYEEHGKHVTAALARGTRVVVVAAGKSLTVANEICDQRLQYLVVRLADEKDDSAVAAFCAAEDEKARVIMDRMMAS